MKQSLLRADGHSLVVAMDHPLATYPCAGLEMREDIIGRLVEAGADAVLAAYGTVRDCREAFAEAKVILKLDLTTVTLGGGYPVSEYRLAWSLEDAQRLQADGVMTIVQLGTAHELEELRTAALVAAMADTAGLVYVCEILPIESERFPKPTTGEAVAAAVRVGAELGAHMIKTSMPSPPEAIAEAVGVGTPVVLAGGARTDDLEGLLSAVRCAMSSGAAGIAYGRNIWGASDPEEMVRCLSRVVHSEPVSTVNG